MDDFTVTGWDYRRWRRWAATAAGMSALTSCQRSLRAPVGATSRSRSCCVRRVRTSSASSSRSAEARTARRDFRRRHLARKDQLHRRAELLTAESRCPTVDLAAVLLLRWRRCGGVGSEFPQFADPALSAQARKDDAHDHDEGNVEPVARQRRGEARPAGGTTSRPWPTP